MSKALESDSSVLDYSERTARRSRAVPDEPLTLTSRYDARLSAADEDRALVSISRAAQDVEPMPTAGPTRRC